MRAFRAARFSVIFPPLSMFSLVLGCGDGVVLEDEAGAYRLQYDCSVFQPAAHSTSEFGLVRDYAIRAVSYANKVGHMELVRPMMAADAKRASAELEQLVVEYLCGGGGLAAPIEKKPSDGPSIAELREEFRSKETPLELHTPAPAFTLPLLTSEYLTGESSYISLSDWRGKYVLLNFWGSWCSPCLQEHEELVRIWERFRHRDFLVYGIVYHDEPERAWAWVQEHSPDGFPSLVDEEGEVAFHYRVRGVPRTYLLGPEGDVVRTWLGWNGRVDLTEALDNLLPKPETGTR